MTPRLRCLFAVVLSSGLFLSGSFAFAIPETQIRKYVAHAQALEREGKWDQAREIYELLLSQQDPGLKIRDRYNECLRRSRQVKRHQDQSYRKEVLSLEYGQALRVYNIISKTLLEGSLDKKKVDPTRLFRKGLEEFEAALADPLFVQEHIPAAKHADVPAFRNLLRKTWQHSNRMTREDAAKQIGDIAMAAELTLNLNATVVAMEFACGACYAIDEYTVYLTPNQLRDLAQSLSRTEAIGVGIKIEVRDNRIVVEEVGMESPAINVLEPNDQIVSVDKKAVVDLPLQRVKELLEGPVGSMVEIEFLSARTMQIEVRRFQRRAMITSVNAIMWPQTSFGYLRISAFTEETVQDIDAAIDALTKTGMKGLILDLRANGGGIFDSSIESARRFLPTGIIASLQHQDGKVNPIHSKNPNALTLPITVLVDGDTACAAEVLAGALKDNNRALLIGQTTYGKGCTQCVLKLPAGAGNLPTGGMKLTVARFFSPKGVPYSVHGIAPHIFIDEAMAESQSMMTGGDPYVARAVEELNRILSMPK